MFAEGRKELLAAIVVVDAIGEPHLLQVCLQCLELMMMPVCSLIGIDSLQHLSDAQVMAAKLVEGYVTAIQRGLREVIDVLLLTQRQLLKSVQTVSEQL